MRTFTVEKEVMLSSKCYEVASDGTQIGDWRDRDPELKITVGFIVHIYDDNEHIESKFYPVVNPAFIPQGKVEKEVLAQIKADFPPSEYQNNDW